MLIDNDLPLLISQCDMDAPVTGEFGGGEVAFFTRRAPDKREGNEDALALIPHGSAGSVLLVADGMGGGPKGEEASGSVIAAIATSIGEAAADGGELRNAILDGAEKANSELVASGVGAATTLIAVEINGAEVRPYHVGDAAMVVTGQRGKLKMQTVSHSPVAYAVEAGLLNEDDALNHQQRNLVSNVVGDQQMRIEIGATLQLATRDTLVMGSDGLFDNLYIEEICDIVRVGSLDLAARALQQHCEARMIAVEEEYPSHRDDLAFIIFRRGRSSR